MIRTLLLAFFLFLCRHSGSAVACALDDFDRQSGLHVRDRDESGALREPTRWYSRASGRPRKYSCSTLRFHRQPRLQCGSSVIHSGDPARVGILVKRELFRIPIFSTAMMRAQFTPVDRGDRESSGKSVSAAARILKEGLSYAIFAEGTRSPDGRLRPFKKGGFTMAIEAARADRAGLYRWHAEAVAKRKLDYQAGRSDGHIRPSRRCVRLHTGESRRTNSTN